LSDLRRLLRRIARSLGLAAFLGLAAGYSAFYAVYPNMTVPSAGEASFGYLLVLLVVTSVPAGFLTSNLQDGVVQVFLSIPFSIAVASILSVSPIFTGIGAQADVLVYDVVHNGFFIFLLALFMDVIGGSVGLALRERLIVRASARPPRIR